MIQAQDVDRAKPWANGQDRQEDQALSFGPDGRVVGWVKHLFADGAYDRLKLMDKATYLDFDIEIIRRSDNQQGFEVLPRRWGNERTFGWMVRWR